MCRRKSAKQTMEISFCVSADFLRFSGVSRILELISTPHASHTAKARNLAKAQHGASSFPLRLRGFLRFCGDEKVVKQLLEQYLMKEHVSYVV